MDEWVAMDVEFVAILFAVMYTLGLCSTFQMFMPGVGQRQGNRPTWDKMRGAVLKGRLDTVATHVSMFALEKQREDWHNNSWNARFTQMIKRRSRKSSRAKTETTNGKEHDQSKMLEMQSQTTDADEGSVLPSLPDGPSGVNIVTTPSGREVSDVEIGKFRPLLPDAVTDHDEQAFLMTRANLKASGQVTVDKTWDDEHCNGQSTVSFSISASEGRNVILRNLVGKIAANLALRMQTWQEGDEPPATPMQIIDGFADEGHRIGAYYLMRAVSTAFYLAMPPPVALRLASEWIKRMNACKAAANVDIFDEGKEMPEDWGFGKGKKLNVFDLLPESDQRRSEIQFVQLFHALFPALNAFTLPVDFLFDRILKMPILAPDTHKQVVAKLSEHYEKHGRNRAKVLKDEEVMEEMKKVSGATDRRVLTHYVLPEVFQALDNGGSGTSTSASDGSSATNTGLTIADLLKSYQHQVSSTSEGETPGVSASLMSRASEIEKNRIEVERRAMKERQKNAQLDSIIGKYCNVPTMALSTMSMKNPNMLPSVKTRATSYAPEYVESSMGANAGDDLSMRSSNIERDENSVPINFFHPTFISQFGPTLFGVGKGVFEAQLNGENNTPLNAAAFVTCLKEMVKNKADPLSSDGYYDMRPLLSPIEKVLLIDATQRRHYAFDHVETVAAVEVKGRPTIMAIYLARGRPDKWQPWTKSDHRRKVKRGVWVCHKPSEDDNASFWRSRRKVGLVENFVSSGSITDWREFANVYWYSAPDESGHRVDEGSYKVDVSDLQVLNTHLGKAGGLNFGLEALMRTEGVFHPSETFPMMFGIIDARHSCDSRFWTEVLPAFYLLRGDSDEFVSFDPEIVLCQIPHSYIGTKADTDRLDMRNDFLFSGMAIIRDRSYGMTSCGTGGIWSITSPRGAGSYFYGRTMIEDTSTSHLKFFEGKRSIYLPPKRGTDDQLMRATPKVSANYLEALERWDTGAVQIFLSMSIWSPSFWLVLSFMVMLCIAVMLPMFTKYGVEDLIFMWTGQEDRIMPVVRNVLGDRYILDTILLAFSAIVLFTIFGTCLVLSFLSPRLLNNLLRYLIILFNSIYPFNSVATIFWLSLPPWLCFTAEFPFNLDVMPAVIGSLLLQLVQFAMVGKMKKDSETQGSELDEVSIFRSQQLDLVTVPIKLRAVMKGLSTGYRDVFKHHDNSWWESFGAGHSKAWVQTWLLFVFSTMAAAVIVGPIHLIMAAIEGVGLEEIAFPIAFGMSNALIIMWVISSPLWYLVREKRERPKPSLRYVNLALLVLVLVAVLIILGQ